MTYENKKLGAFIVPTGIGASIGGYAGDASVYARKFAKYTNLIVNPNVVNAGCFSGITSNMLYTEGFTLDCFFKNEINLVPAEDNKIGIIYDRAIPEDVLNIHINTQNAVKTVYGVDICEYTITDTKAGVDFYLTNNGVSTGSVKNISTIIDAAKKLIENGCNAIGIVCLFKDPEDINTDYANGSGPDPVGGVEAIISHCISKYLKIPCAHSPAFTDYSISTNIVNSKAASEYITPTFLPCILLGLSNAPQISTDKNTGINISNLDFLVMPHNSLGAAPVFEALSRDIKIYAVKENVTELDVTNKRLFKNPNIIEISTYDECLDIILKS